MVRAMVSVEIREMMSCITPPPPKKNTFWQIWFTGQAFSHKSSMQGLGYVRQREPLTLGTPSLRLAMIVETCWLSSKTLAVWSSCLGWGVAGGDREMSP